MKIIDVDILWIRSMNLMMNVIVIIIIMILLLFSIAVIIIIFNYGDCTKCEIIII